MKMLDAKNCVKDYIDEYINGTCTDDVSEKIESDYFSMMEVIRRTGDKKMYGFASDEVKNDYRFVKFMIRFLGKDDLDLACTIADRYIDATNDWLSQIDLILRMMDLTEGTKFYRYYYADAGNFYCDEMDEVKSYLDVRRKNNGSSVVPDRGFRYIFDKYNSSPMVIKFFATRIMRDILFNKDDRLLEHSLHKDFDSFNQMRSINTPSYLINLLGTSDAFLAAYIVGNAELLQTLDKNIAVIKSNWESFNAQSEALRYDMMFDAVHEYILNHGLPWDEFQVMCSIGDELGHGDEIREYLNFEMETSEPAFHSDYQETDDLLQVSDLERKKCLEYIGKFSEQTDMNSSNINYKNIRTMMQQFLGQRAVSCSSTHYDSTKPAFSKRVSRILVPVPSSRKVPMN